MDNYLDDAVVNTLTVPKLKDYLRVHGQFVSGRRPDLVQRAMGIRALEIKVVSEVKAIDHDNSVQRQHARLTTCLGEKLPDPHSLKKWSSDLQLVPDFTEKDIYNYLVLQMKAKRQMKSLTFYKDRHVHSVEYHGISDDCSHCIIRCKVIPSLPTAKKMNNPDHNVWICLAKESGRVNSAECNCTAGQGESCNHIGALLYALVDITSKRKDGSLASTSNKCTWNNPRKRKLSPKKAEHLSLHKLPRLSVNCEQSVKSTCNIDRFKNRLMANNSNAGWLTNFEKCEPQVDDVISNPTTHNVDFMYHDSVDLSTNVVKQQLENHFDDMAISQDDCSKIKRLTRGQSKNSTWKHHRNGRITSSKFGQVMQRKKTTRPDNLVKTIMNYTEFYNRYLRWGRSHEPAARRSYVNVMKRVHPDIAVSECGLIINPEYPHLGCSPDGLVSIGSDSNHDGLIEIKCPASDNWKFISPRECANDVHFFCTLNNSNEVVLKRNHVYYFQVQGQLAISKRQWCDFVVWTLKPPLSIERIYFDAQLWETMSKKLKSFYLNGMLPEIFSHRVLRSKPLYTY